MSSVPRHVAVIMDGNGRWAQQRGLERLKGHEEGAESVREVVRCCGELGVEVLTLYSFSTENWKRPAGEVRGLMRLLARYLVEELPELMSQRVQLMAIGELKHLPKPVQKLLTTAIRATRNNDGLKLCLALSYGARAEMVQTVRELARDVQRGLRTVDEIDEDAISETLYTRGLPDPDLLIRTSGELRLSNFLLWQLAYAELYVTEVAWPDFRGPELEAALASYGMRERRFGSIAEQIREKNR